MSGPLFFDPLPVPTRLVGGEGVSTYASRHATRNFSNVKDIERAVREQGYPLSNARSATERLALWRQLGKLRQRAFTEPQVVNGNWVIDRALCSRCMPPLTCWLRGGSATHASSDARPPPPRPRRTSAVSVLWLPSGRSPKEHRE